MKLMQTLNDKYIKSWWNEYENLLMDDRDGFGTDVCARLNTMATLEENFGKLTPEMETAKQRALEIRQKWHREWGRFVESRHYPPKTDTKWRK